MIHHRCNIQLMAIMFEADKKKQTSSWHHPSPIGDDVWTVQGRAAVAGKWQQQRGCPDRMVGMFETRWNCRIQSFRLYKTNNNSHNRCWFYTVIIITPKFNLIYFSWSYINPDSLKTSSSKYVLSLLRHLIQNLGSINVVSILTKLVPVLQTKPNSATLV